MQCPLCSGRLHRIAVVETKADILAILTPLGLARPHERPFAHGPPRPEVTVLVAADSGAAYPVDPPRCEPRLPYPRQHDRPLRYRSEVMETGEKFDQTGFELPPAPKTPSGAHEQGQLFDDDYAQPDAADGEPVFWTGTARQPFPDDEFVQADPQEAV